MDGIFAWCKDGEAFRVRVWLDEPLNDVNLGDDHGFGPLHWACLAGRANIVEMLLSRGARVNANNMGGDTPLHLAASFGHEHCAKLLLENGAKPNACNEHGNTPLHYATFWGNARLAELLVTDGGLLQLSNGDGDTPLDKCHRSLRAHLHELAVSMKQDDASKKVSYKQLQALNGKTRDVALSRHAEAQLSDLKLESRIELTASGETWRGVWNQKAIAVAVKFINYGAECSARVQSAFRDEHPRLRIFSHPNVLPVLCVCAEPPSLALVSQYLPLGSLYSVLHERRQTLAVDYQQSLRFALDVARGMAFLHSLEQLPARLYLNSAHVLIDDDLTARVNMADAKFSFQERNRVYQPAWLSPEALQKKQSEINVRAANMWSFAVLLWELGTRQVPFEGLSAIEIGMKVALEDLRVHLPATTPQHLARLTRICMHEEPGKRPSFDQVIPILTKMASPPH